jgi:transcriptional regulator NrdR family protein
MTPPCPSCHCQHNAVLEAGNSWSGPWERRVCRHCGRQWTGKVTPPEPARPSASTVYYDGLHPARCPECGSAKTRTTSSPKPADPALPRRRHHKCLECKGKFQSVERLVTTL